MGSMNEEHSIYNTLIGYWYYAVSQRAFNFPTKIKAIPRKCVDYYNRVSLHALFFFWKKQFFQLQILDAIAPESCMSLPIFQEALHNTNAPNDVGIVK